MNQSLQRHIDELVHHARPRAKSLIVSLLGDVIEPRGGSFWVGTLIDLMAPFNINERSVRTSLQRLGQDGWLDAQRHGRRSRYHLTRAGRARILQARRRFYEPPLDQWHGQWLVAFAPPGSLQAWQRSRLRQLLDWEGYSMIASGLFVHPLGSRQTMAEILSELGLEQQVFVFVSESLDSPTLRTLRDGISDFWDLEDAETRYLDFEHRFANWLPILETDPGDVEPAQYFQTRLLAIHLFRRASLHAPRLPSSLFPADWAGLRAYETCRFLYQHVWAGADAYIEAVRAESGEPVAELDQAFFERFGGLNDRGRVGSRIRARE
ncbi:PaaX family transcriptional regulator C-terminal domain-containing protein [Salinisphaera sp. P385]|uniref:PaaX family transcriptional regulator C-terminal domain-containing protein n=1 Tax=Spectribacter acetivorans TaxID=3075603 RepID=A0ABU3B6P8_9GAMM|nr:PaaX family transcriptional regulator C-terminal domain-containing protein [Salinisphaera sp. P385]MDT0617868.1 PaaX family transcriptional regulator C-terminal domain-containing protein [Salinisphaera sp. P385]